MKTIGRKQLREKMERGDDFALVEVLSAEDYERLHLPGAINVPIGSDFAAKVERAVPDKRRTVVVYSQDADGEASTHAAAKLDALGYRDVWDYEAGKLDWKEAGLRVVESRRRESQHSA